MPDLLVEVGCEELPSSACREIIAQAPELFAGSLEALGLEAPGTVELAVAPRRFALVASGVPDGVAADLPARARAVGRGGLRRRGRAHAGGGGLRPRPGRRGREPGRGRGGRAPLRLRRAPGGRAPRRGPRARGGRPPGRRPALLQDHALGRRDRPQVLAPRALDSRQGQRAGRPVRAARAGRRRPEPGPSLPGRPGGDPRRPVLPPGAGVGGRDRRSRAAARPHRLGPRRRRGRGGRRLARPGRQARRGRVPGGVAERGHRALRRPAPRAPVPRAGDRDAGPSALLPARGPRRRPATGLPGGLQRRPGAGRGDRARVRGRPRRPPAGRRVQLRARSRRGPRGTRRAAGGDRLPRPPGHDGRQARPARRRRGRHRRRGGGGRRGRPDGRRGGPPRQGRPGGRPRRGVLRARGLRGGGVRPPGGGHEPVALAVEEQYLPEGPDSPLPSSAAGAVLRPPRRSTT